MKVTVLKPFGYAADGITIEHLSAGREIEISDDLVPGLRREGFVALASDLPEQKKQRRFRTA